MRSQKPSRWNSRHATSPSMPLHPELLKPKCRRLCATSRAISTPVLNALGQPAGIVEGSISATDLASRYASLPDHTVTVVDREQKVIYSSDGARFAPMATAPIAVGFDTPVRGRYWRNEASLLTVKREQLYALAQTTYGWTVIVDESRYDAIEQAAMEGTLLFMASVALFAALLFAVSLVNATVSRPLKVLEARAAELDWATAPAPGIEHAGVASAPREVAVVGDALQRAAKRIHDSYLEAQRAVAEREQTLRDLDTIKCRGSVVRAIGLTVEAQADLAQRLEDVGARALRGGKAGSARVTGLLVAQPERSPS